MIQAATEEEIRRGKVTDVSFERTRATLGNEGINKRALMEPAAKELPPGYSGALFAGLEGHPCLPEGLKVEVVGMRATPASSVDDARSYAAGQAARAATSVG